MQENFNPRSREGSDVLLLYILCLWLYFNPRSREGSDPQVRAFAEKLKNFNPRSREGSDYFACYAASVHKNFNPRSREGSDESGRNSGRKLQISIHAPARGATCPYLQYYTAYIISIHAPARGATVLMYIYDKGKQEFQSTLPRGERR